MATAAIDSRINGAVSPELVRSAATIALGSLLFGFEMAVISGVTTWLRDAFDLSDAQLGFAVASGLFGAIGGSLLVARPADWLGRRNVLFVVASLFFVQAVGCAFSWSFSSFVFFRFLGGLAVGSASVIAPLYIAELAPAAHRGRLVTLTQLNIVLGILLSYLSNFVIGQLGLGALEARWMFGVMAAPSLLFLLLLFSIPQSPRWLIVQGRRDEAEGVFQRCGLSADEARIQVEEISSATAASGERRVGPLFSRRHARPIKLAVAVAFLNQACGINAVLYYAPEIFRITGAAKASALLQSVLIGSVLLVFTVLALAAIDRVGRRPLMIIGSLGYLVSLGLVVWSLTLGDGGSLLLWGLMLFVASHAIGQGAVIWVFIGEIFPTAARARGQALGSFTHWITGASISWTFPVVFANLGGSTFAIFGAVAAVQLLWACLLMPETKGVPLEAAEA